MIEDAVLLAQEFAQAEAEDARGVAEEVEQGPGIDDLARLPGDVGVVVAGDGAVLEEELEPADVREAFARDRGAQCFLDLGRCVSDRGEEVGDRGRQAEDGRARGEQGGGTWGTRSKSLT